jgi:hypothetical protein
MLAQQTIQAAANHGRAALRSLHPGPHLPWRLVTHMLPVPTLKLGYPLTFGVLVKPDNLSPHTALGEIFVRVCLTYRASAASDSPTLH